MRVDSVLERENRECASKAEEDIDVVEILAWVNDVLVDGTPGCRLGCGLEAFKGATIVDAIDIRGEVFGV